MKKILLIIGLIITAFAAKAQTPNFIYHTPLNTWYHSVKVDSLVRLSGTDTADYPASTSKGCFMFQASDNQYYYSNGSKWGPMGVDLTSFLAAHSITPLPPLSATDSTLEFKPSTISSATKFVGSNGTTYGTRTADQVRSDIKAFYAQSAPSKPWDSLLSLSGTFNTSNLNSPDGTNYANGLFIPYDGLTNVGSEIMTIPATHTFWWRTYSGGAWTTNRAVSAIELNDSTENVRNAISRLPADSTKDYASFVALKDSMKIMRDSIAALRADLQSGSSTGTVNYRIITDSVITLTSTDHVVLLNPADTILADHITLPSTPVTGQDIKVYWMAAATPLIEWILPDGQSAYHNGGSFPGGEVSGTNFGYEEWLWDAASSTWFILDEHTNNP